MKKNREGLAVLTWTSAYGRDYPHPEHGGSAYVRLAASIAVTVGVGGQQASHGPPRPPEPP